MNQNPNKKQKKLIKAFKGNMGEIRKAHFEAGGSPQTWRGTSFTHGDKRSKRNDRGVVKKKSIKDSDV